MGNLLLIAAVICFALQAFSVKIGSLAPAWWALGVAFYLAVGLL